MARATETGVLAIKTETNSARSDAGLAVRPRARRLAERSLSTCRSAIATRATTMRRGCSPPSSAPGQIGETRGARCAKAHPRRFVRRQNRARHQARLDRARLPRHRARRGRRRDADVLCARRRVKARMISTTLVTRYFGRGSSRFLDVKNKDKAMFTHEATPIARAAAYAAGRRRRDPAALAGVQAAHGGRACDERVRDSGAAAAACAGAHGAARHFHRPCTCCAAVQRIRQGAGASSKRDQQDRRRRR